ncbi:hypothetical protein EJ06DRAFT_552251 [Trichodelitschia bisporula]|uniref:Secreted protein n=1 Tax=Trichodelitschia bisporula TaxID=703511 RepID=A0A6G1HI82_9PEZI|nr:hypothetical protein EJ06DRAFT_552251 [Trichodelitschia bisporula]
MRLLVVLAVAAPALAAPALLTDLTSLAGLATLADLANLAAPAGSKLTNFAAAGTGCPASSANSTVAPNGVLHVTHDALTVAVGPEAAVADAYRACQILIGLSYPAGWQYSVKEVATWDTPIQGPASGPLESKYEPGEKAIWSPCGPAEATVNVKPSVRLGLGSGVGGASLENTQVLLQWKQC